MIEIKFWVSKKIYLVKIYSISIKIKSGRVNRSRIKGRVLSSKSISSALRWINTWWSYLCSNIEPLHFFNWQVEILSGSDWRILFQMSSSWKLIETNFSIKIIISRLVKFSSIFKTDCSCMVTFDFYILNFNLDNNFLQHIMVLRIISAKETTLKLEFNCEKGLSQGVFGIIKARVSSSISFTNRKRSNDDSPCHHITGNVDIY